MSDLELDPGECWIRHIKRAAPRDVVRTNLVANPASNPSPTVTSSSGSSSGQPAASVVQTLDWSAAASAPYASRYTVTRTDAAITNLVARTATGTAGIPVKPGHYYAFRFTVHIDAVLTGEGSAALLASIRARLTWATADGTAVVTGVDGAVVANPAVDSVTELYVIGRATADAAFVSIGGVFSQGPGLLTLIADLDAFVLVDLGPDFAGPTGAATLNADVPAYFDGRSANARWTGIADGSPSELLAVDPDAIDVLSAQFTAQPLEGVNGRQGWQSAQPEVRLSDDGSFSVTFPNAAGEDGVRHLKRFALLTDPLYRAGEEWLEFYREPDDGEPLFVGTPTRASKDGATLTIEGLDALVLLRNVLSSEADLLVGMAPTDALRLYGGCVTVLQEARDFAGWTPAGLVQRPGFPATSLWDGGVDGYSYDHCAASPEGDGILLDTDASVVRGLGGAAASVDPAVLPVGVGKGTDWIIEARYRHLAAPATSDIRTGTANFDLAPRHDVPAWIGGSGVYAWSRPAGGNTGAMGTTRLTYPVPGVAVHRIIARGDWLYCFVNGELIIRTRRSHFADAPGPGGAARADADHPYYVLMGVERGAKAVLQSWRFLTLEPLLMPDAPADTRLPGVPPVGGLRGRYYLETNARAHSRAITFPDGYTPVMGAEQPASFHALALDPLLEPYAERLETPDYGGGVAAVPTFQPAGPPSGEAWSVRWTGAIYLDLESTDRELSFGLGGEPFGRGRVYVGGKLILDYTSAFGNPPPAGANVQQIVAANLRAFLGARAGWFPILIEYSHFTGNGGFTLSDKPLPGAAAPVPASRLSPLGTVDREVRNEGHRDVFGELAESFGYQWRLEPRSLESGRFPGELVVSARVGRDVNLRIGPPDDVEAFEVAVSVDAGDTIDGLLADASGLADNTSDAQLSLEAYRPDAVDRLVYTSAYESLAEISEASQLQTRAESLLISRSSPAETVGVRPAGTRKLVDRFPLPATPELQRMLWLPGDAPLLDLPDVDVVDQSPRQLTIIQWPLTPDGAAPPIVSFRQRTRGGRAALERLTRAALQPQRYYQGQLAVIPGAIATNNPGTTYGDSAARCPLPANLDDVVKLELYVLVKTDASPWTVTVNGASTGLALTRAGRYDITRYLRLDPNSTRMFAGLTGGTGIFEIQLFVTVRI